MSVTVKTGDVDVVIEPGEPDTKLFIIDGFTLKVEVCEDSDGNGWGIRYTTYVKDSGIVPSVWFGDASIEDQESVNNSPFQKLFDDMTQEQAEAGFRDLLKHAGGFVGKLVQAGRTKG